MNKLVILSGAIVFSLGMTLQARAHCQIPCGIYADEARIDEIHEHIDTIDKSIKMIGELSLEEDKNYNQIVRWVNNKEAHAQKIQDIVEEYFLTQRIKPVAPSDEIAYGKYIKELTLLHNMLISAMKVKQTTDLAHVNALSAYLDSFSESYLSKK